MPGERRRRELGGGRGQVLGHSDNSFHLGHFSVPLRTATRTGARALGEQDAETIPRFLERTIGSFAFSGNLETFEITEATCDVLLPATLINPFRFDVPTTCGLHPETTVGRPRFL